MKPTKSRTSWRNFSLLLLLLLAPLAAHASGGGDDCDDLECSSFFAPEVIQSPSETPFFRSYRIYYQHAYDVEQDQFHNASTVNVDEWFAYFGGSLKRGTLAWVINKMPASELDNLVSSLKGAPAQLSPKGQVVLSLLKAYGQKTKVLSALAYLQMAKAVEPIANRRSGDGQWDPSEQQKHLAEDTRTANDLIAASPKLLKNADAFVASRVRLQVIRLYFYTMQYGAAEAYFEANRASIGEGSVKWRFVETAAGAYYKDKNYGVANYLYSLVFGNFPAGKKSAYFSFHPVEQADWNASLSLAKSTREKTVLWQLLGIYADGLAAIDQIVALDPRSDLLPLLLVREVNKAEEDWSANREKGKYDDSVKPAPDRDAVGVERLARLKAVADAGLVGKLYLWKLAVGHLEALAGDQGAARSYLLASAQGMPNDPLIRAQARASLLLSRVLGLQGIERGSEDYLAHELSWLASYGKAPANFRAANLDLFLLGQLSSNYTGAGDNVRGLMLKDTPDAARYTDVNAVNAILAFRASAASTFDKFLVKNYDYSSGQLRQLQGLASLYKGDLKAARGFLTEAGEKALNQPIYADTFSARIVDCHDCELKEKPVMTLSQLLDRLIVLDAQAAGRGEEAARANLLLGNAFYNISYYGNSRAAYSTPHGNLSSVYFYDKNDSLVIYNQKLANSYYDRAAALSQDRELRAKATFLAAKTEQNTWYNTHDKDDGSDIHPGKYYGVLKGSYSDTQYYKEVLRECGYFRKWAEK